MATAKEEDSSVTQLPNVAARRASITNGFKELYKIEVEIAEKTEKHLKALKDLRTKTWRNIKKDVDIPRKVLSLQYKNYKAVKDAEAGEEDELDILLDHLREMHLALHQGETLDWVKALDAEKF